MVTNLMRDHISLCKIPTSAKAVLQRVEEIKVDINALIVRAVEWSHRGAAATASGQGCSAKKHQLGRPVDCALMLHQSCPHVLGIRKDCRNKRRMPVVGRRSWRRALLLNCTSAGEEAQHRERVDTKQ